MTRHGWRHRMVMGCGILTAMMLGGCGAPKDHYGMEDYARVRKIDAHVHDNVAAPVFETAARENGFRILSINVDYPDFPAADSQYLLATRKLQEAPDVFAFASTFLMQGFEEPGWMERTLAHLDSTIAGGAVAVKFWKNIGMVVRDRQGRLVMINDPRLHPVFQHLVAAGIPVVNHTGEPRDCWLAVDKMMSNDMKEYFSHHPQYHMFLHPEMPSYEDQIRARDSMLQDNPTLPVMGAHLGSQEWSVTAIESLLVKHPNMSVDIAARMDYLELQAQTNREGVRGLFLRHPDRILYGTDVVLNPGDSLGAFGAVVREKWVSDWKFLATDSTQTVSTIPGQIPGLALPKEVIDKVYCLNAERLFPRAWRRK